MDPTLQFLAGVVRAFVRKEDPPAIQTGHPNWERLRHLLLLHQILPTTFTVIRKTDIPAENLKDLEQVTRHLRIRSELLLLETLRFYPTLSKSVSHAVLLKGAALFPTVYAHRGGRSFLDIDILIDKESLETACDRLGDFGLKRPGWLVAANVYYDRHHYHYVLHQPRGVTVEVHWDLSRPQEYIRFDLEGFVSRSRLINVGGIELRIPHETDTLLHTASQALYGGFSDLRRIIDVALLLEACTPEELQSTGERAHEQGLASALWILLGLTESITGIRSPDALVRSVQPPAVLRACFGSLGLRQKLVAATARERTGLRNLLVWLSAPDIPSAVRSVGRYLFPGNGYFLQRGVAEHNIPGPGRKAAISLQHGLSILKLFTYLAWRLVTHFRTKI